MYSECQGVFSPPGCIQYARVYSVRQGYLVRRGVFNTPGLFSMPGCIQYSRAYSVCQGVFSTPGCIQYARVYSVHQGVFSMPGLFSTPGLVRQGVFSIHGIECIQYVWVCIECIQYIWVCIECIQYLWVCIACIQYVWVCCCVLPLYLLSLYFQPIMSRRASLSSVSKQVRDCYCKVSNVCKGFIY